MSFQTHLSTILRRAISRCGVVRSAFRLALIGCLVMLGAQTANSIRVMLTPSSPASSEVLAVQPSVNVLPAAGSWRFGETQSMVSMTTRATPMVPPQAIDGETISIERPGLKALVEIDENFNASTAAISWRFDDDWHVFTLGRNITSSSATHLLPLSGSKRLGGRWSDDDQLVMEIVSVQMSRRELLRAWRQAGWEIRHTGWGTQDAFSFLCVKDKRVVYAWSQQAEQIRTLLLSITPDVTLQSTGLNHGEDG